MDRFATAFLLTLYEDEVVGMPTTVPPRTLTLRLIYLRGPDQVGGFLADHDCRPVGVADGTDGMIQMA